VNGNAGDNTLSSANAVAFYGAGGNDFAVGCHFDDLLRGHSGNDTLSGGGGNDILTGERGHDEIEGGSGNDNMSGGLGHDFLDGGSGDDTVIGGEGRDTLYGDTGNDSIWGGAGADDIMGSFGNDTLVGHRGADTLSGGDGVDVLTGGAGADGFVWSTGSETGLNDASDIVKDFKRGEDLLDLSEIGDGVFKFIGKGTAFSGTGKMEARFFKNATEVRLVLDVDGDGNADSRILLEGLGTLTASDFIL
jgi:Ca2+-binding RTX toxin-like protein